jgi:hypothetical protein
MVFLAIRNRVWVAPMHVSITTVSPPALARAAASSLTIPA